MSDVDTINKFVGTYVSGDKWYSSDPKHNDWYPQKGIELELKFVALTSVPGGGYARLEVGLPDYVKTRLEAAIFVVVGNKLQAVNIEVVPGLLLTETLEMVDNPETGKPEMKHWLKFSDGAHGWWICHPLVAS
jgi:hypothetical protein